MARNDLVVPEKTDLKSRTEVLAKRLDSAFGKLHKFYDIIELVIFRLPYRHLKPRLRVDVKVSSNGVSYCEIQSAGFGNIDFSKSYSIYLYDGDKRPNLESGQMFSIEDVNSTHISPSEAKKIVQENLGLLFECMFKNTVKAKAQNDLLKYAPDLLEALILDPNLTPEEFFKGFVPEAPTVEYSPLDIIPPDVNQKKAAFDVALAELSSPSGFNLTVFGDDVADRAAKDERAINAWQNTNNHRVPKSFRLMKGLSDMVADIKREDGAQAASVELLLKDYQGISRQINALRDSLPEDRSKAGKFLEDTSKASQTSKAWAQITELYYKGFKDKMNELMEQGFDGGFLGLKLQTLHTASLARQQKSVEIDHMTIPTYQGVYMALTNMIQTVDTIDGLLSKAIRSAVMKQMKQDSRPEDFNLAATGMVVTKDDVARFYQMTEEQQDETVVRNFDVLKKAVSAWNDTMTDLENAILRIEDKTSKPLLLTYVPDQSGGGGVMRLLPSDDMPPPAL